VHSSLILSRTPLASALLLCTALSAGAQPEAPKILVFVQDGVAGDVQYLAEAWTQAEGYVEAKGTSSLTQRLLGNCSLGAGDFTVNARLAIIGLASSAAVLSIGDSYFGFAGGHGKLFLTGPLFDNAQGKPIGEPTDFITEAQPFDLLVTRAGDKLTIAIDGKTAHEQSVGTGALGAVGFTPYRATMRIYSFAAEGNLEPYKAPNVPKPVVQNIVLDPRGEALPGLPLGPFVRLSDGAIMGVDGKDAVISRDEGKTWQRQPIFTQEQPFSIRPERALLRTRSGVIILVFINNSDMRYSWDKEKNLPLPDMRLPSYSIRSLDEGKTWTDLHLFTEGWCGCLQDIIQTSNGNIVVPGQELLYKEGRHITIPYVSSDDGKTWQRTRVLDIGGQGDHAGAVEGTVEELKDGRLWLLMRSAHGYFYESYSSDQGLTWTDQVPSAIRSTSAPGKLKRLASGRLAMLWNPLPDAQYKTRELLVLSLSDDEGRTWSPPQPLATNVGSRVSYIYPFERVPGELWVTSMQGGLRAAYKESDYVKDWARIVCFGDSTTAPRQGLTVYADLLQRELKLDGAAPWLVNAGIGGNNTADALTRLDKDVLQQDPKLVIVAFGINDSAINVWENPPATAPRISLEQYRQNLTQMVDTLKASGIAVVLMTPNPLRWSDKTKELYGKPPYDPNDPDGFNLLLKDYAAAVREIAKEKGVPLVDVWAAFHEKAAGREGGMDSLLLDGMHPNQDGQRIMADLLLEKLATAASGE